MALQSPLRRISGKALTPMLAVTALTILGFVLRRAMSDAERRPSAGAAFTGSSGREDQTTSSDPSALSTTLAPVFTDVTTEVGLDFVHVCGAKGRYWLPEEMGSGGAFLDYDNDGDMDIYLVQSGEIGGDNDRHRNRLYRNDGSGHFEDVSWNSGADVPGYGMGCAAADYDNDGDVDLYVTRLGPNVLLRNNGDGMFTDVTRAAGVSHEGFGAGAAFGDFDRDGFLDLYVTNYVDWSFQRETSCYDRTGNRDYCSPLEYRAASCDVLYRNTHDGRFEDVTVASGIGAASGNGLGVLCTDFDGDGWLDIFVANDQTAGFLWMNQSDGTFLERAALGGCAYNRAGVAIAGMGVESQDLDDDGDFDLLVTNIHDQAHLCLQNQGGFFEDVSNRWGSDGWGVPYTAFGVGLFDQDHDGMLDLFVANGAVNRLIEPRRADHPYAEPNQFVRRDASGRFYDASAEGGSALRSLEMSRGTILGDYDNDGDVDVLVTNNRGPARLLRNNSEAKNAWVVLDLVPRGGGRNAISARLEIQAGGRTIWREVRPHVGYLGSNDPRVHVGLGKASVIERLSIDWPDGRSETWNQVLGNRHLLLRQGESPRTSFANTVDPNDEKT